ncbi:hypothetical protein PR048_027151 [Dryococelus australis]|uniref:Uncharacterized protein n=1 Tax=Dryococelus australis TaxID=614101 RepID=A0ABQ9GEM1_9NEOP|nr:hypothetical protein PR048_027151 [Dryococelus australis]
MVMFEKKMFPQELRKRFPPGFWHVGIAPGDAAGRRVFSEIPRFPHPLAFRRFSILRFPLISSQDLAAIGNLSQHAEANQRVRPVTRASRSQSENGAGMKGWGETGDTRENAPARGIVRHDSHMRKFGSDPAGDKNGPAYLHRISPVLTEKRGSYKGYNGTRYKSAIAATRKDLNWHAVYSYGLIEAWSREERLSYQTLTLPATLTRCPKMQREPVINHLQAISRKLSASHRTVHDLASRLVVLTELHSRQYGGPLMQCHGPACWREKDCSTS